MKKKSFTLDKEETIREFNKQKPNYEELDKTAYFILEKKIKESEIKIHSIHSRVKHVDSFCDKIERFQIDNPFEYIQDILGLRVICLFLSDISKIGDIIRENFTVIKEDNKVDDSKFASFGYMSVHFIVKLGENYEKTIHADTKDLVFEIQVRTIAMDAWANISHYLDYKTDQDIPIELKRDFYALSGMFYVADKHFQLFFEQREEKQEEISNVFEKGSKADILSQPINLDTLTAYLHDKFPERDHSESKVVSRLVEQLTQVGYKTIEEINKLIENGIKALETYEENSPIAFNEKYSRVGVVRFITRISNDDFLKIWSDGDDSLYQREKTKLVKYKKLLKNSDI